MFEAKDAAKFSIGEINLNDLIDDTKIMLVNHVLLVYGVENFYIEKVKDIGSLTCDMIY